jgi:hypothetical protein
LKNYVKELKLKLKLKNKFIRDFKTLNIGIYNRTLNISNATSKLLYKNDYLPTHRFDEKNPFDKNDKTIKNMINRIKFFIKKYINKKIY